MVPGKSSGAEQAALGTTWHHQPVRIWDRSISPWPSPQLIHLPPPQGPSPPETGPESTTPHKPITAFSETRLKIPGVSSGSLISSGDTAKNQTALVAPAHEVAIMETKQSHRVT